MSFWKNWFWKPESEIAVEQPAETSAEVSNKESADWDKFTTADMHRVALDMLYPLPSADYFNPTIEQCNRAQEKCNALREQYKNYQPERLRHEIMSWISYSEGEIRKSRDKVKENARRAELHKLLKKAN